MRSGSNVTKKKGFKVWRPASLLEVRNREPGYHYRWVNKEPLNISKKLAEGWEFAEKEELVGEDGRVKERVTEYRTLVLMKIDEETRQAREEYYSAETDRQSVLTPKQRAMQNVNIVTDGVEMPADVINAHLYNPSTLK
jgi:hypothetical protein